MEGTRREGEIAGETSRLLLPRSRECRRAAVRARGRAEEQRPGFAMSQSDDEERKEGAAAAGEARERAQETSGTDEGETRERREQPPTYVILN